MPTTTITDSTLAVSAVGARTDSAGAAVTDYTAEEVRFAQQILTEGYLQPAAAFQVTAQSSPNMTVRIGSQTSRADYFVVAGDTTGQGNYICRLDVTSQNITISASDASQTRTDEIYLVVYDNAYDSTSRVLPRFGYRKGDLGGANPGPDTTWKASVLLARITVGAGVSTITNSVITDMRSSATLTLGLSGSTLWTPRLYGLSSDITASSTTPVTAFSVPIDTVGKYLVEGFLHYAADPSSGMKMTLSTPTATGRWTQGGINLTDQSRNSYMAVGTVPLTTALSVTGDAGGPAIELFANPDIQLAATATGTLSLAISQANSSGSPTILRSTSVLRVTRYA